MVPKQVSYRFPGIDYCTVSIQRGKVPIPMQDLLCIHLIDYSFEMLAPLPMKVAYL